MDKTTFDINQVIRNTTATFEGLCRQKNISLELVLTGEALHVRADMEKIQQIIYNLTDNAVKFSHHNSVIKIETSEKKNKLSVSTNQTCPEAKTKRVPDWDFVS